MVFKTAGINGIPEGECLARKKRSLRRSPGNYQKVQEAGKRTKKQIPKGNRKPEE